MTKVAIRLIQKEQTVDQADTCSVAAVPLGATTLAYMAMAV